VTAAAALARAIQANLLPLETDRLQEVARSMADLVEEMGDQFDIGKIIGGEIVDSQSGETVGVPRLRVRVPMDEIAMYTHARDRLGVDLG